MSLTFTCPRVMLSLRRLVAVAAWAVQQALVAAAVPVQSFPRLRGSLLWLAAVVVLAVVG